MGCGKEGLRTLRLPSGGWDKGPEEEVSIIARFPAACAARGKCEWGWAKGGVVDAQEQGGEGTWLQVQLEGSPEERTQSPWADLGP